MKQATHTLGIDTRGQGFVDITTVVRGWMEGQGIATGLLTLFCRHTSASLLVQENASPDVRRDLLDYFAAIAPQDPARYRHDEEGPDDMPAHIRTALTQTSLSIPVLQGQPALGTWQAIYLFEHRNAPHRREVVLHLIGA